MKSAKRNIFISIVACVCSLVAALILLFYPAKTKDVEASADASTTLYWEPGAAMNVSTTTAQRIKFTLHIDEKYNVDGLKLYVMAATDIPQHANIFNGTYTVTELQGMRGCCVYQGRNPENGSTWTHEEPMPNEESNLGLKDYIYVRDCKDLFAYDPESINEYSLTKFYIDFVVEDIYKDYTLVAGIYDTNKKLIDGAVSDTRTLRYIWEKAYEHNDPAFLSNPYLSEYLEFEEDVEKDEFVLSSAVQISSVRGLTLQVNIPDYWRTLLYNPTQAEGYKKVPIYTNYFLAVRRAASSTVYYFSGETLGSAEAIGVAMRPLPESFKNNRCGSIDIPIGASDNYFVEIVKCVSKPKHIEMGIFGVNAVTYANEYETLISTVGRYISAKSIAADMLGSNFSYDEEERKWLLATAGLEGYGSYVPIKVKYKQMRENAADYGEVISVVEDLGAVVPIEWAFSLALVESSLANFNVVVHPSQYNIQFHGSYMLDGNVYNTEARIIQQARKFNYTFYPGTNEWDSYGVLEVIYEDFQYKDLNIRITNNDWDNHLTMNWYTTLVDVDANAGTTTITYTYDEIEEQLYNSCLWLFDINASNIVYNSVDGVTVTPGETSVTVTYQNAKVNNLLYLSLTAVAEIVEDYDVSVTYKYQEYVYEDFQLKVEERESDPITMRFSRYQGWLNFDNFMNEYGAVIEDALDCGQLIGEYYVPTSITKNQISRTETPTAEIIVGYDIYPIFKIMDNIHNDVLYKSVRLQATREYWGEFFVNKEDIPQGYRISSISSTSSFVQIDSSDNYTLTTVKYTYKNKGNYIIPITITYTDFWNVKVDYMNQIKGTPFAELVSQTSQVKVSDYADIYALTKEDVLKLLPIATFEITGSVTVSDLKVEFDNVSTYTVSLEYSHASLKQINYEGERKEMKVPLTSFADWCASFGKDWSILMLNTTKKQYFKYSSDVSRDKLYGLFSVAIFEEQVSDLNYWFKNVTGDGQMEVFSESQVQGSQVYKFFNSLRSKGIVASLHGHVGMAFCELINEDNKINYMHYFYLDGTNPNGAYVSNGGADNAEDTDKGIVNKGEDIGDSVKETIENFKNSPWMTVLYIALGLILVTALVGVAFKILTVLGVIGPNRYAGVQQQKKKKSTSGGKKKKSKK